MVKLTYLKSKLPSEKVDISSQLSLMAQGMIVNPLKGRDVNWLHFAIQV